MKCPNCAAEAEDGAAECPSCSVLIAKFLEKRERERLTAETALAAAKAPPRAPEPWRGRTVAAILAGAWVLALGLYYRHRIAAIKNAFIPAEDDGTVMVRDPRTGDMRPLKIIDASAVSPEGGR